MASIKWGIKQGDNSPGVSATLKDADGGVIDLTACTVKFNMRLRASRKVKISLGAVVLVVAASGTVRYDWQAGDTDAAGIYEIEWQITDAALDVQTVPTKEYDLLQVYAELA